MVALLVVGCSAPPTEPGSPGATARPSTAATTSAPPSVGSSSTPESASDLLECDGPVSEIGGRAEDFGPFGGGETPDQAFDAWIATNPFVAPRSGYRALGRIGDRAIYTYEVDGRTKIVLVISPRLRELVNANFTVEEFRTCDPSEYGADVDLGDSRRAWAHRESGELLIDIEGPAHCGWESARMMHVEEDGVLVKQYLRDPHGVFDGVPLLDAYADGVALPEDATDSGYRSPEGYELWFTKVDTAAYVVTPDGVERWPRPADIIGCA